MQAFYFVYKREGIRRVLSLITRRDSERSECASGPRRDFSTAASRGPRGRRPSERRADGPSFPMYRLRRVDSIATKVLWQSPTHSKVATGQRQTRNVPS